MYQHHGPGRRRFLFPCWCGPRIQRLGGLAVANRRTQPDAPAYNAWHAIRHAKRQSATSLNDPPGLWNFEAKTRWWIS
jgi:hypothetical protein